MLVVWFGLVGFLTSSSTTRLYRGRAPRQERLTILRAATHETELGDHDFCLSRSHYTDTEGAGGHSGNRTRDLLTRSRALYRRATAPPLLLVWVGSRTALSLLADFFFFSLFFALGWASGVVIWLVSLLYRDWRFLLIEI